MVVPPPPVVAYFPSMATLNFNSLSHYALKSQLRLRKRRIAQNVVHLSKRMDIICGQETKLNPGEDQALASALPGWGIYYGNHPDGGQAGVIITVSPALKAKFFITQISTPSIWNGFLLALSFVDKEGIHKSFTVINVYFPQEGARQAKLIADIKGMELRGCVHVMGDFNFVEKAADSASPETFSLTGGVETEWTNLKTKMGLYEVAQETHTFMRRVKDRLVTARLDRIYTNLQMVDCALSAPYAYLPDIPYSILPSLVERSSHGLDANAPYRSRGCSDHVPVANQFRTSVDNGHGSFNVPRWLVESKEFKTAFVDALADTDFSVSGFGAMEIYKEVFYDTVRRLKRANKDKSMLVTTILGKISVSVAFLRLFTNQVANKARIEKMVMDYSFIADAVCRVDSRWDCEGLRQAVNTWIVEAVDPVTLGEVDELHFGAHFNFGPSVKAAPNPITAIKVILPSSRAQLPGLRETITAPLTNDKAEMARIAKTYYDRVWEPRPDDGSVEMVDPDVYLEEEGYSKVIPPSLLPTIPDCYTIMNIILSTNSSSAGPDGIPFIAYRATAELVAPIFREMLVSLGSGVLPPDGFNYGLLYLLPKKGTYTPDDTRPLSVTNSDNRILAKILAYVMVPACQTILHPAQKGFIPGRDGSEHIIQLNEAFYGPIESGVGNYHCLQIDTRRAFDSVDHGFIIAVLRRAGFPEWIVNSVKGLLHGVMVTPFFGVRQDVWISILRGVKQGCCLSPLLFAICYDPLLESLGKHCPNIDLHAFADDLNMGATRRNLFVAAIFHFDRFKAASGLEQNIDKSGLYSSRSIPGTLSDYDWIQESGILSDWKGPCGLRVGKCFTYLGVLYGRYVTTHDIFWPAVLKAVGRLLKYHTVLRSMSYAKRVLTVNVFILSLFSYLVAFFPFPYCTVNYVGSLHHTFERALVKAIVPYHGTGFKYCHIVMPPTRCSPGPAVKDLWAWSLATLAAKGTMLGLQDTPRCNLINADGTTKLGRQSMIITTNFVNAAKDVAAAFLTADSSASMFDAADFVGRTQAKTRAFIYKRLVVIGYAKLQDDDLRDKIISSGRALDWTTAYSMVDHLHANFSLIKARDSYTRYVSFSIITNALPTPRRVLFMKYPNKLLRDAAPRPLCAMCGVGVAEAKHIFGECAITKGALHLFAASLGLPPNSGVDWMTTGVDGPAGQVLVRAMALFTKVVWLQYRSFFSSLSNIRSAETSTARLVQAALSEHVGANAPTKGLGSAGRRSKEQTAAALDYATKLEEMVPVGSLILYTDGGASPNPGPAGAGVYAYFKGDPPDCYHTFSFSLGHASNNLAELWGVGMALQAVLVLLTIRPGCPGVYIFTDSLGTLRSVSGAQRALHDHNVFRAVRKLLSQVADICCIMFAWVPGHCGILGNDCADEAAGDAARVSLASKCIINLDLLAANGEFYT